VPNNQIASGLTAGNEDCRHPQLPCASMADAGGEPAGQEGAGEEGDAIIDKQVQAKLRILSYSSWVPKNQRVRHPARPALEPAPSCWRRPQTSTLARLCGFKTR
jgi:hypothetical protein